MTKTLTAKQTQCLAAVAAQDWTRFAAFYGVAANLEKKGLIRYGADGWELTDAGRALI